MTTLQNFQFAAEIYNQFVTTNSGNFAFSPLAVEIILALIHAGAYGETARQISTRLNFPKSSQDIQQIYKNVTSQLQNTKEYTLNSAIRIYIKDDCEVKHEFKILAKRIFNAEIENIDFRKKEEAVTEMNEWVEEKSRSKIRNLISSNQIDYFTRTVLMNVVFFCGKWEKVFSKYLTSKLPFHLNDKSKVEIAMMTQKDYFGYYDSSELDATFLEMPYEGKDVTINFVLPKQKEGLEKLESRISDIFASPQYSTHDVLVVIPKFQTETSTDFKPILQALDIVDAFEDTADFSGIVQSESTKISALIQKAYIEVHENGTTAAAAADSIMELPEDSFVLELAPPPLSVEFIADHPFLFYIKFKEVVLFIGRFSGTAI